MWSLYHAELMHYSGKPLQIGQSYWEYGNCYQILSIHFRPQPRLVCKVLNGKGLSIQPVWPWVVGAQLKYRKEA